MAKWSAIDNRVMVYVVAYRPPHRWMGGCRDSQQSVEQNWSLCGDEY